MYIYIVARCLSLRNKDTEEKKSGVGAAQKRMLGEKRFDGDGENNTKKKMIWKRRIEEKISWQRKRAKIKIEKMGGKDLTVMFNLNTISPVLSG